MQSFVEIKESLSNISDNAKVKLKKVASTVGVTSSNENDSVELDPLEELAEFCPKLTYQQVWENTKSLLDNLHTHRNLTLLKLKSIG